MTLSSEERKEKSESRLAANTEPSSTIYLGNVPEDVTPQMIFDAIGRPGAIEALRILPHKHCAFLDFVRLEDAQAFASRRITLRGHPACPTLNIKPAKASAPNAQVRRAISNGATRNIFLGGCEFSEQELRCEVEATGAVIDTIKVFPDRKIAFVHCVSVAQAIHAVLEMEQRFKHFRINYGDDRCGRSSFQSSKRPAEKDEAEDGEVDSGSLRKRQAEEKHRRTIFLGGIPDGTSLEDLCDVIRGGALESVRILKEKNTAFISFLDSEAAHKFHEHCNTRGLFIRGQPVKRIGWADIRIMSSSLSLAVKSGATRVLFLGNLSTQAFSRERLMEIGSGFGIVESVKFIRDKNIGTSSGFISFGELKDAIYAHERISNSPEFKECKVGYAKDRCDDPLPRAYPMGYSTFADGSQIPVALTPKILSSLASQIPPPPFPYAPQTSLQEQSTTRPSQTLPESQTTTIDDDKIFNK